MLGSLQNGDTRRQPLATLNIKNLPDGLYRKLLLSRVESSAHYSYLHLPERVVVDERVEFFNAGVTDGATTLVNH
jgi:hypothetical protein